MIVFRGKKVVDAVPQADGGLVRLLLHDFHTRRREHVIVAMSDYQNEKRKMPGSANYPGPGGDR